MISFSCVCTRHPGFDAKESSVRKCIPKSKPKYQIFHLRNLNLMKNWEYTRICEDREDAYTDIKKWRQLHIMLILLQKEIINMSQIGKKPTSVFNICREV